MGYSPIGCRSSNQDKGFQTGRIFNSFSFCLLLAVFIFITCCCRLFWKRRYLKLCSEFPIYLFSVIVSTIAMIIICFTSSPIHGYHLFYILNHSVPRLVVHRMDELMLWWSCCWWKMYGVKRKLDLYAFAVSWYGWFWSTGKFGEGDSWKRAEHSDL